MLLMMLLPGLKPAVSLSASASLFATPAVSNNGSRV
jgi:hypothetical protein